MFNKIILIILSLCLFACASPKAVTKKYEISEDSLFVPINLDVSAGEYVTHNTASVVSYLSDSISKSGQFSRIDRSFLRWPYTVEIRYSWEQPMDAADFAGTMLSASTLLIVPGYMDEIHTMEVTVLQGDVIIRTVTYTAEIETALSLWHDPIEDRKNAINMLLEDMFKDFRANHILPTIKELEPSNESKKTAI